jgi:hypothetical protein
MYKEKEKLGVAVHTHDPSYSGGGGRKIRIGGQPGKSVRPYPKNKLIKAKGLEAWCKW